MSVIFSPKGVRGVLPYFFKKMILLNLLIGVGFLIFFVFFIFLFTKNIFC